MFTQEQIASFNELETSIYQYIIHNRDRVTGMRIRDVAAATHVSPSTVLRFCRKAGCEGFAELKVKIKLAGEGERATALTSPEQIFAEFAEKTLDGRFRDIIKEVAEIAAASKSIIFAGGGSSGILAQYGAHYFSGVGKFSTYISDPYFPVYDDLRHTTAIVLSNTGETRQIIQLAVKLQNEGSRLVSITNNKTCTLAKMSEVNISYYMTEERYRYTNITTQLPVLYFIEAIAREMKTLQQV